MSRTNGRVVRAAALLTAAWVVVCPREVRGLDMSPAVQEHVRRSTIMVMTEVPGTDKGGSGTGFFINGNGLLITNNHVVDPNHGKSVEERAKTYQQVTLPRYKVIADSGTKEEKEYSATVLHQTESGDMAILQLDDVDGQTPQTPYHVSFLPIEELVDGMTVWIFGFPGGLMRGKEVAITKGLITELLRAQSGAIHYVESDATAHPGNSGGPMVGVNGRLVGVLTHKRFGDREKDRSGAVPIHLVEQFILSGFREGRIPKKAQLLPFVTVFTDHNGIIRLPNYPREPDACFVHHQNGTVQRGELAADHLAVTTTLGDFDVPLKRAAYLFVTGEEGVLIMDGGDRLVFPASRLTLPFKFPGGQKTVSLAKVAVIAFARNAAFVDLPAGPGVLLDADGNRLALGQIKDPVSVGGVPYPLETIVSIESDRKKKTTVRTRKGEQLARAVEDKPIAAATAWSDQPVQIRLSFVAEAGIRPVNWNFANARGRLLAERLDIQEDDLRRIAEHLDRADWEESRSLLTKAGTADRRSRDGRKQIELFKGVERMRAGDFPAAAGTFKHLRSKSYDIGWIAEGYLTLLDTYRDGQYLGKPLSEPDAMWRASTQAARQILEDVEARMARLDKLDYKRKAKELESLEEALDTANRLEIGIAQSKLMQVLEKAYYAHIEGWEEMREEYNKTVDEHNRQSSYRTQVRFQTKLSGIENRMNACEKEIRRIYQRLTDESAGFVVEPPKFDK